MLGPIETLLAGALQAGLPGGTEIVAGPAPGAPTAARLLVQARSLVRQPPPEGEARGPAGGGAWLSRRHALRPDPTPAGNARAFTLPAEALPVLEEVQAPRGTIAPRGDAYVLDGRTIRFAADQLGPVEALTRGGPALGWHDRAPALVRVDLVAEAPAAAEADSLLGLALAAGMGALVGLDVVTLAWIEPAGLRLRLLDVATVLDAVERDAVAVGEGGARWARCTAALRLCGALEVMVAVAGAPAEGGVIAGIETTLELPGGRRTTARSGGGGVP